MPTRSKNPWRYIATFGKLIAERQIAVSVLMGYFDQREELNQKIQAEIAAERQESFGSDRARRTETGSENACFPRVFFL